MIQDMERWRLRYFVKARSVPLWNRRMWNRRQLTVEEVMRNWADILTAEAERPMVFFPKIRDE